MFFSMIMVLASSGVYAETDCQIVNAAFEEMKPKGSAKVYSCNHKDSIVSIEVTGIPLTKLSSKLGKLKALETL